MSALDTLIYGIKWVYNAGSALTQRTKINLVAPLFATDDIPNARTNIGLAAGLSVVPTPTAPDNQVLQNTGTAMAWQPYTEYGAAPAASGDARHSDGGLVNSAGALDVNATTVLTLSGDDVLVASVDDVLVTATDDVEVTGQDITLDAARYLTLDGALGTHEKVNGTSVGEIASGSREIGPSDAAYTVILGQDADATAVRTITVRGADDAGHGTNVVLRGGNGAVPGTLALQNSAGTEAVRVDASIIVTGNFGEISKSTSTSANPYTVLVTDREILYGATGQIDLLAAPDRDTVLWVFSCGAVTTTVNGNGNNINGAATLVLGNHKGARLKFDGTVWWAYLTA